MPSNDGCVRQDDDGWTHTHDLQTAVRMNLSNVSGAEPPLTRFVHKVFVAHVLLLVVAHGDIGAADQNFSSWVWLVFPCVAACANPRNKTFIANLTKNRTDDSKDGSESYLQPNL